MSLAHRLIGTVLFTHGGRQVKGKGFASDRTVGMALQAAKVWAERGLDELVLLDVTAGKEGRGPDLATVERVADELFIPLAVGGGIRSLADADALFRAGADKVVIGTCYSLIARLAERYGSQAIVAAVDAKDDRPYVNCGRTGVIHSVTGWAERLQEWGAGELLVQSIDRDGTRTGYDLDLIRKVAAIATVPVVASSGCRGGPARVVGENMKAAMDAGADAVAAGAVWLFDDVVPGDVKAALREQGVVVR